MIYFITGGERSGKSGFAQKLALQQSDTPTYLATARKWDKDFEARIARHQAERDHRWTNVESEVAIASAVRDGDVIVLDCVTLWLTNIFTDTHQDVEKSLTLAKEELEKAFAKKSTWIIISNEIGMGVHAASELGRKFVELQGWTNQYIAAAADQVYLMVSGIEVKIK